MENISKINKQFDIFGLVHRYLYIVPISDSWGIEFQRVLISDSCVHICSNPFALFLELALLNFEEIGMLIIILANTSTY